jgi:isocitrate dehydrogenase
LDVIVTLNLYGDIVSDIAAQITGSVGLGGSANIGEEVAMFEAIHGSAPDIAGQNIANPSGLINAAVLMLVHLEQPQAAEKIMNAWITTIEQGIHTGDIYKPDISKQKVGTQEFAEAVIKNLGKKPEKLQAVDYTSNPITRKELKYVAKKTNIKKELVGTDVFIDWKESDRDPQVIGKALENLNADGLKLKMITNRGVKVYPGGMPETFCTDHWRCRFVATENTVTPQQLIQLLEKCDEAGFDFIKTENLYTFNGERGYSLGQGE